MEERLISNSVNTNQHYSASINHITAMLILMSRISRVTYNITRNFYCSMRLVSGQVYSLSTKHTALRL